VGKGVGWRAGKGGQRMHKRQFRSRLTDFNEVFNCQSFCFAPKTRYQVWTFQFRKLGEIGCLLIRIWVKKNLCLDENGGCRV